MPNLVSWHKLTLPQAHFKWDLTLPPLTTFPKSQPQNGALAGLGAAALARLVEAMSDPIDIWLSGGLILEDCAPVKGLKWWADQKSGGYTHKSLMQMALDVMASLVESLLIHFN